MDARDIVNLQEAYLQVYSEPELTEEALIAAEYFYEQGLNEDGVNQLIEDLGVDEFVEWIDEIVEEYSLYEAAKRGGTVLKGAALRKSRAAQAARTAEFSTPSTAGRSAKKAYKTASREARLSARQSATEKAKATQTPTPRSESPSKTKGGIGAAIGGALKWAQKKGKEDFESVGRTMRTARQAGREMEQRAQSGARLVGQVVGAIRNTPKITKARRELQVTLGRGAQRAGEFGQHAARAAGAAAGTGVRLHRQGKSAKQIASAAGGTFARHLSDVYREEFELILSHLLDEGYAETLESAEAILESMSEEWASEILDEAIEIMSVTSPEGKRRRGSRVYSGRSQQLAQNARKLLALQKRQRENPKAMGSRSARAQAAQEVEGNAKKSIRNLNVDPNSEVKYGYDTDREGYREVPTDYRARKRRASGR